MIYKMIVNGQETVASDNNLIENVNPTNGKSIGQISLATKADLELAAKTATQAQPAWAAKPLYERIEIFKKFVALVKENKTEIAKMACTEGGKLIGECNGELDCLCVIFDAYAEAARNLWGHSMPINADPRSQNDVIFTVREPLGVFFTITPFNFPIELYAHKVAPALITGNAVIIKPATETSVSSIMLTKLLLEAGVPAGIIQCVTARGSVVGEWLKGTDYINAVSFTGSTNVGVSLMEGSSKALRRVFLELGGNDPYVVFEDCDMELAVSAAVGGRAYNAGQTCCANKRFIIQNSVKKEFTDQLIKALKALKIGDPADPATQMGPQVTEKAAADVVSKIEYTVGQGAKLLLGGKRNGAFVEPTVLSDVTADMDVAKDLEIFGPVFPILGFDTFDEAVALANNTSYGLASGVITNDVNKAIKFANSSVPASDARERRRLCWKPPRKRRSLSKTLSNKGGVLACHNFSERNSVKENCSPISATPARRQESKGSPILMARRTA